jgi:hypothetical protein
MKARFNYPSGFTSLPDYTAHAGQMVEVGPQFPESEAERGDDPERLFAITADDGWTGHAFESELDPRPD